MCTIVLAQVLFELNFASSFVCIMHGVERRAGSRDLEEKLPKQLRASSRNIGKENNCEANGALSKSVLPFCVGNSKYRYYSGNLLSAKPYRLYLKSHHFDKFNEATP